MEGYKKGVGRTRLKDRSMGWIEWRLKVKCKVKYVWTPGHEDIDGNERADKVVKAAAPKELPVFLRRKPLLVSISAIKNFQKRAMKK